MKQEAKEAAELGGSGGNAGERRWWLSPGRPGWRWKEVGGVRGGPWLSIKEAGQRRSIMSLRQRICRARLAGKVSPEVRGCGESTSLKAKYETFILASLPPFVALSKPPNICFRLPKAKAVLGLG